jgi:hypothetical protein
MLGGLIGILVLAVLVVGPLLWRIRQDRRVDRALAVRAQVYSALVHALGGESLVAVHVDPPAPWRPGRVILDAPVDWHRQLAPHWAALAARVPGDYELVVKPVAVRVTAPVREDVALPRAA